MACLTLALLVHCAAPDQPAPPTIAEPGTAAAEPLALSFAIKNAYPHDTAAFTEGLQFVGGSLLESTGLYGQSTLRRSALTTGRVLQQTQLPNNFFGEGCTQLNGLVYQLTYKEGTCLVYDARTLKLLRQYPYNFGEGWGLTHNDSLLIVSNGGSNLFFFDPATFKELKRVGVSNAYGPLANLNELEWIDGYVYANIWQRDVVVKINPETGVVVGEMDLSELRRRASVPAPDANYDYVLNGLAYDSVGKRLFVTGKNWSTVFELSLSAP
jgi:glutaminyl-peptide cyclotransferase